MCNKSWVAKNQDTLGISKPKADKCETIKQDECSYTKLSKSGFKLQCLLLFGGFMFILSRL